MSTRKNRKHSLSEKLQVIALYQSGKGCFTISKQLGITECLVKHWIRVYQSDGFSGFDKRVHTQVPAELKQQAVKDVLEKSLSFETVALKYKVSTSAVYSWVQRVKQHGYPALTMIKRGRPGKNMGRPKKKEPETDLEKLQEEVRYLRAENAYLKKLRALVEERIARENGKQPGPSKN